MQANMTPKQFFEMGDSEMKVPIQDQHQTYTMTELFKTKTNAQDVSFWKKGFSAVGEDGKVI